ncbi:MAG: DEAD/DEAH box helicase [Flavobacteriales bacterium]|nr:DEAD/DEAH box helicase [Flavobacteriales bacterium]
MKKINRYNGHKAKRRPAKRKRVSEIDPQDLIKKAKPVAEAAVDDSTQLTFDTFGFHEKLNTTISKKGFINPTPIQAQSFSAIGKGKNIVGIANTGTGKTGAFLIPLIDRLLKGEKFQTLIVLPTRELALQVEHEFKSLTKDMKMYSTTLIGGTSMYKDIQKLKRSYTMIIGTPGRIMDMVKQKALDLRPYSVLVLDEFDRMLDMGFLPDVQQIVKWMPSRKQTVLYSATIQKGQAYYVEEIAPQSVRVQVHSGTTSTDNVDQDIIKVSHGHDKFTILEGILQQPDVVKTLIFAETKQGVDRLMTRLLSAGYKAETIHGDKSQHQRLKALSAFTKGKVNILVATDVAARGLDVADITHVINYQLPATMDSYIHRIGRTGRAGKTGVAFTFVDEEDL